MDTSQRALYPRASGKCDVHHVPDIKVSRSKGLQYLHTTGAQLVKGDLVIFTKVAGYRNDGILIVEVTREGTVKLVHLLDEPDDYGTLPKWCTPIEDQAPLSYWHNTNEAMSESEDSNSQGQDVLHLPDCIQHNYIVWLKRATVINKVQVPVSYGIVPELGVYRIYTVFLHKGKEYTLVYSCVDEDYDVVDYDTGEYMESKAAAKRVREFSALLASKVSALPVSIIDYTVSGIGYKDNVVYYMV